MSGPSPDPPSNSAFQGLKAKYLSLNRWAQVATIIGPVVAIVAAVLPLYLTGRGQPNPPPSPSPLTSASTATASPVATVSSAATSTTGTTTQTGIPAVDLGSWGGELVQAGVVSRFILNLNDSGSPGSLTPVGTFDNQTGNCQGDVLLNGITGNNVVDLNLETTQNPQGDCVSSAEADVQLAPNGVNLELWMIVAGNVQGSLQDPLATAILSH